MKALTFFLCFFVRHALIHTYLEPACTICAYEVAFNPKPSYAVNAQYAHMLSYRGDHDT
jgi:hypothetical protein